VQHEAADQIACKHGAAECTGNLLQLCVAKHTPHDKNYAWLLNFLTCTWDSDRPVDSRGMVKKCLDKVRRGPGVEAAGPGAAAGRHSRGNAAASGCNRRGGSSAGWGGLGPPAAAALLVCCPTSLTPPPP
jgi:hypothetical protein